MSRNFQVEGYHTYYIGRSNILVHNSCESGYSVPNGGGGGVSDTVTIGNTRVTFGHGGRRLGSHNLTTQQVYTEIAKDVVNRNLSIGQYINDGFVNVGGIDIIYHAYKLAEDLINIGTFIFP